MPVSSGRRSDSRSPGISPCFEPLREHRLSKRPFWQRKERAINDQLQSQEQRDPQQATLAEDRTYILSMNITLSSDWRF
jgi:hypothetical protein